MNVLTESRVDALLPVTGLAVEFFDGHAENAHSRDNRRRYVRLERCRFDGINYTYIYILDDFTIIYTKKKI